jgi:hypothetical protein
VQNGFLLLGDQAQETNELGIPLSYWPASVMFPCSVQIGLFFYEVQLTSWIMIVPMLADSKSDNINSCLSVGFQ